LFDPAQDRDDRKRPTDVLVGERSDLR
jgi:hypothetical protein